MSARAPRERAHRVGAPGERAPRRLEVPRFALECGATLVGVTQAYYLDGEFAPGGRNLVLVFHALTGSADAAGPEAGWWRDVVGPGRAVDTGRWAVLCPNLLGSCYGMGWSGAGRRLTRRVARRRSPRATRRASPRSSSQR